MQYGFGSIVHFIEFIDTADPLIWENKSPRLQYDLLSERVFCDVCSQPHRRSSLPRSINSSRSNFINKSEELRFSCWWVSNQKNVDLVSEIASLLETKIFFCSSEELSEKSHFDMSHPKQRRSKGVHQNSVQIFLFWKIPKFLYLLIGEQQLIVFPQKIEIDLILTGMANRDHFDVILKLRSQLRSESIFPHRLGSVNSDHFDFVSWFALIHQIIINYESYVHRGLSLGDLFGYFLKFNLLLIGILW